MTSISDKNLRQSALVFYEDGRFETPNGRAQLNDLASRGSIGPPLLLRDWKFG